MHVIYYTYYIVLYILYYIILTPTITTIPHEQVQQKVAQFQNIDFSFKGSRECDFIERVLKVVCCAVVYIV